MLRVVQYLNHIPFGCTLKQYFPSDGSTDSPDQSTIDSPELWDELRVVSPHFQVPAERKAWEEMCMSESNKDGLDGHLPERAFALASLLKANGFTHVHSAGVGSSALEFHLKKIDPTLHLTVSDYPPGIVETLEGVFHECDVIRQFDILGTGWSEYGDRSNLLVVLNRLDPLFTNQQWTEVFAKMAEAGVVHVLYMPAWILTINTFWVSVKRHLSMIILNRPNVFTGWTRNRRVQASFWGKSFDAVEISLGNHQAFMLTLRASNTATPRRTLQ